MMSPTGSAIASPPSEPSCYEDRPEEDDDVDLGVPDPLHRLVGARDDRGAVTLAGAAFECVAVLTADSTTSARALYLKNLPRGGRRCVLVRPNLLSPNSPGLEPGPTMRTVTRSRALLMPRTFRWRR